MLQEAYKIYAEENSRELKGIKEEIDRLTKEEELIYQEGRVRFKREIEIYPGGIGMSI